MCSSSIKIALGVIALIAAASPQEAFAVTSFNVSGAFGGSLIPQNAANQTDTFYTEFTGGLDFNEAAHQATLQYTFAGTLFDFASGPAIGTLSGQVAYIYENVQSVSLNGESYILALTPNGQGDGVGAIANITLTSGGLTDSAVFDLNAMPFQPTGTGEEWINLYQPVAGYLEDNSLGAYLILGNLQGTANAVKSWFGSEYFGLALGEGRNGNFKIQADLHGSTGSASQVPEPATMLLLGAGLSGAAARKRRVR